LSRTSANRRRLITQILLPIAADADVCSGWHGGVYRINRNSERSDDVCTGRGSTATKSLPQEPSRGMISMEIP
jgi:hypothetical protein